MISTDYLPNIGGLAAHIYFLSQALSRLGHEVFVVNPICGSCNTVEEVHNAGVRTFRIHFTEPRGRLSHIVSRSIAIRKGLNQILEATGPVHVWHQHDHRFSTFAMQWASRFAPWIWTNHTSSFLRDYESNLRRWLVRAAYRGVNGVIAVSDELHQKSETLWGGTTEIEFIPNGVDVEEFSPRVGANRRRFGLRNDEFVVLCPRRMAPKNGVIYMVRAAERLVRRYPGVDWKFVFLGGNPVGDARKNDYADQVREAAAVEVLQGRISFLGDLPLEEMPKVNACSDMVVMPSLMEAVSLSALEGMAAQKPVVATNVGGLPQIVHHEETGLLVPPRNPEALANAVYRVYSEPELRCKIASAGRQMVVSQYSWQAIAQKTIVFYQKILSRNGISI